LSEDFKEELWDTADKLRANSSLKYSEFAKPVLGIVFLRYADFKFSKIEHELQKEENETSRRRKISETDYIERGAIYLPENARYSYLLNLPEGENIGHAMNEAMKAIEGNNEDLKGVLDIDYQKIRKDTLIALLNQMSTMEFYTREDVFGEIYEYFLGKFALKEGQRGGQFFTPESLVKLIVEVLEPTHGRIYDPACGAGGMFIQSANFLKKLGKDPSSELSFYGQEVIADTIKLCKMNLAVHGLFGQEIKQGNTYYEDVHNSQGRFDFVMSNPPFNVSGVDKEKIKSDKRFSYGIPTTDNANYLWIQMFLNTLNETGKSGFVMANSAMDIGQSELELRKKLIESKNIDIIINIATNFFHNVTLPCTLWFFDKGKKGTKRENNILFIDAREIYNQIDRAHRDFLPEQIDFIGNIARLYKKQNIENTINNLTIEKFPDKKYLDISGLCKIANIEDIVEQGYSLNPGRYVGIEKQDIEDVDFLNALAVLKNEFSNYNEESSELEKSIESNLTSILKNKGD